jgi:hypothetical protein
MIPSKNEKSLPEQPAGIFDCSSEYSFFFRKTRESTLAVDRHRVGICLGDLVAQVGDHDRITMDHVHQGSPVARRLAARTVTELPAMRKRVSGMLWPLAHGKRPARSALDAFTADWRKWSARRTIAGGKGGFTFQEEAADPIGRMASRAIATTAELLLDVRPLRVR